MLTVLGLAIERLSRTMARVPSSSANAVTESVVQQLAVSVQNQTNMMELFRKDRASAAAKKEKKVGFLSLDGSSQVMLLNASSQSGEVTAAAPCADCTEFFSKTTIGTSKSFLLKILKKKFKCLVDIATGIVTA